MNASPRRFELIVFDWDGTLVDSAGHIVHCLQSAFRDLELPVPAVEAARHVIGLGMNDALSYLNPGLDPERYAEVAQRYSHHFLLGHEAIEFFPRVESGIEFLNSGGYLLAVATGKSRRGLDRALKSTPIGPCFHASRCADEGFPKPHPDMLETLMELLGAEPERTLMFGDTTHDLQMAASAGVEAVAAAYGAHPREALEDLEPLACVDSFGEFLEWLDREG
jgi:phosphoglycolate phosphatase